MIQLHENTRRFLEALNKRDMSHPGVKAHYDTIRASLKSRCNKSIEQKKESVVPKVIFTKKLFDQMNFSANEVCRRFNDYVELSGICTGYEKTTGNSKKIYLTDFHVFHDQVNDSVRTSATSNGKFKTYQELIKKGKKPFFSAHSHNQMNAFHSPTDDRQLTLHTNHSSLSITEEFDGMKTFVPYNMEIVFNNRTGRDETLENMIRNKNLSVKTGVLVPKLEDNGFTYNRTHLFCPSNIGYLNYGQLEEEDKERLLHEISERVNVNRRVA